MLASTFVVNQGTYDLTEAAMRLRRQRPLHCGDDYRFDFELVDDSGDPVDVSGGVFTMTAKYKVTDGDGSAIVKMTGAISNPPGTDGKFNFTLSESDVPGPEHIRGVYDVQMTISGVTETVVSGNIEFLPNITQATP
jgi:hypothetical protein